MAENNFVVVVVCLFNLVLFWLLLAVFCFLGFFGGGGITNSAP